MSTVEKICPSCEQSLSKRLSHYVEVDVCKNCGGLWLDHGEFDALVARRFVGHEAERDMAQHTFVKATKVLHCPVDRGPMVGVEFDGLELDYCHECRGIWLGGKERERLSSHASEHPFHDAQVKLPPDGSHHMAVCSGCGENVQERSIVHAADKQYCEKCVVSGDFPDLDLRIASMSRGHRVQTNSERHISHSSGSPPPSAQTSHLPDAVKSSVDYVRHLFD
jgi:Zn-finger nucleic acid-binding protein